MLFRDADYWSSHGYTSVRTTASFGGGKEEKVVEVILPEVVSDTRVMFIIQHDTGDPEYHPYLDNNIYDRHIDTGYHICFKEIIADVLSLFFKTEPTFYII